MSRDIFFKMSSWSQLFFLAFFYFVGFILTLLISTAVFRIDIANMDSLGDMRLTQGVYAICVFLIPALLCAAIFHKSPRSYFKLNTAIDLKFVLLASALIILIQPAINVISIWNQQLVLPEFMAGVEASMKAAEKAAEAMTLKLILSDNSVSSLLANLLVIAVFAAIVEEFFFRGVIQQLFQKITQNAHLGIWISAIIFSAIHMQFYGFVPRVLLGALLGYLFLWSGSLWIPIIVHFVNNALTVILFRSYHSNPIYEKIGTNETWWLSVVGILLAGVIMLYMVKGYNKKQELAEL